MLKRMAMGLVMVAVGALGICRFAPGVWTQLDRQLSQVAGWTEEARKNNPDGFVSHLEQKLRGDREVMEKSRRELAAEASRLAEVLHKQDALRADAQRLAEEFRDKYQEAVDRDRFPIEVRGAAYAEAQAKSQVSLPSQGQTCRSLPVLGRRDECRRGFNCWPPWPEACHGQSSGSCSSPIMRFAL